MDIHRDTPTEILHTVLLGVVKYYWAQSVFIIEKAKQLDILESRLASIIISGLNIPTIDARYMRKHCGSLIGKHFKSLVQIMPFIVYDMLPPDVTQAWLLLGRLACLLWYTEIDDVGVYTVSYTNLILQQYTNTTMRIRRNLAVW